MKWYLNHIANLAKSWVMKPSRRSSRKAEEGRLHWAAKAPERGYLIFKIRDPGLGEEGKEENNPMKKNGDVQRNRLSSKHYENWFWRALDGTWRQTTFHSMAHGWNQAHPLTYLPPYHVHLSSLGQGLRSLAALSTLKHHAQNPPSPECLLGLNYLQSPLLFPMSRQTQKLLKDELHLVI